MDTNINRRYKKCVICGARRLPKSQTFLANFPLDPDRCRLWVKASGDEDLINLPIEKLHQLKSICGAHFTRDCFNEKGNRLLKHAVPTLALPSPLADDLFTEFPLHVRSYYERNMELNKKSLADTTNRTMEAIEKTKMTSILRNVDKENIMEDVSVPMIADHPSSVDHLLTVTTAKAPVHLTEITTVKSLPAMADRPSTSSMEYIPIASTSKAPMHHTYKRKSDDMANKDVITVQSYKRQKSVGDRPDADHHMSKREKKYSNV